MASWQWSVRSEGKSLFRFDSPLTMGHGPLLFDRNFSQQLEIAEHLPGAQHHAAQRIVRDRDRQSGLLADPLVEILNQRSSAGQHDASVADVGRNLTRRAL